MEVKKAAITRTSIIFTSLVLLPAINATAQEARSEISLQGTGFLTKDSTGQGTVQRSTNTGGFLVGYRYHFNRWLSAESVYGYDRNAQQFFSDASVSRVQANVRIRPPEAWSSICRPHGS